MTKNAIASYRQEKSSIKTAIAFYSRIPLGDRILTR